MEIIVTSGCLNRFMTAYEGLVKRAAKCGQPAPKLTETERYWESRPSERAAMCVMDINEIALIPWERVDSSIDFEHNDADYREVIKFELQPEVIKLNGNWRLMGTVEPSGAGDLNYTNAAPGSCQNDFAPFRNGSLRCDHCNAIRRRNMTIVVKNEQGEVKSVGTDCVHSFLGINVAQVLQNATYAMAINDFVEGDEEGWGGGRGVPAWGLRRVAGIAIAVLRDSGWAFLGRGKARETMEGIATADLVMCQLCPAPRTEILKVTDEDAALAETAIQDCTPWIEEVQAGRGDTLTDYQHNVAIAIMAGVIDHKRVGLVTAAICLNYLRRVQEIKLKNQPDRKDSKHFGTSGERLTMKLHPCNTRSMDTAYGVSVLISGWIEGTADRWDWWTNPTSADASGMVKDGAVVEGVYEMAATVKDHKDDKYGIRTVLTRIAKPKAKKGKS